VTWSVLSPTEVSSPFLYIGLASDLLCCAVIRNSVIHQVPQNRYPFFLCVHIPLQVGMEMNKENRLSQFSKQVVQDLQSAKWLDLIVLNIWIIHYFVRIELLVIFIWWHPSLLLKTFFHAEMDSAQFPHNDSFVCVFFLIKYIILYAKGVSGGFAAFCRLHYLQCGIMSFVKVGSSTHSSW